MLSLFQTVLLPAALAGLIWLLALRFGRGRDVGPGAWGGAAAIAVAYLCTHYFLLGLPSFPPRRAIEAMFFVAIAMAVFGFVDSGLRTRPPLRGLLRGIAILLAIAAQTRVLIQNSWSGGESLLWLGGAGAGTLLLWTAVDKLARQRPGVSLPAALWLVTACGAGVLVMGGVASAGQFAGGIAAALGAAGVLALIMPALSLTHGAAGVWTILFTGLLLQGHLFAEVPWYVSVIVCGTPLALWIGELPGVVRRPAWQSATIRLAIVALPLSLALLLAWRAMDTGGNEYGY